MGTLVVAALVAGILGAVALFGKTTGSKITHPDVSEFRAFVEQRTKEFLDGQDLDSFVRLVPKGKQADFSAKLVIFLQAVVESSMATGLSVLLKIENIEKVQESVLAKTQETLNKSTEVLSRLDRVKDTIASVSELSEKLAKTLRYTEEIIKMTQQISENLRHINLQTTMLFATGLAGGFVVNVIASKPYFSQVPIPSLLLSLLLIIVVTIATQVIFAIAATRRTRLITDRTPASAAVPFEDHSRED